MHTLCLTYFDIWGCFFWGISKNERGCVILVHTEELTGTKISVAHVSTNLLGFLEPGVIII